MHTPLPVEDLSALARASQSFVLLDTARPDRANCRSYLFTDPVRVLTCESERDTADYLKRAEALGRNHWLAGFLAYEAGYGLEKRLHGSESGTEPLSWLGAFARPCVFDHSTGTWDLEPPRPPHAPQAGAAEEAPHRALHLRNTVPYDRYAGMVAAVKNYIAAGDTYQVNLTFDTLLHDDGDPWSLYLRLRRAQPAAYCAFIRIPGSTILSFSPELFFDKRGRFVRTKPMKGTARRGLTGAEDAQIRQQLQTDEKNRAENLMIVDLLRNDLGRVCVTGSVNVTRLFEVETLATLHQMTSTVTGRLRRGVELAGLFSALFPCGSVTGAPKIRTMEIIRELESGPRGVYCGALGYAAPNGNAVFSVPIRILQKSGTEPDWRFRVGSGVVWDSTADREWEECAVKSKFLTDTTPEFDLLESILWDGRRLVYLREHAARMRRSAQYWDYPFGNRAFSALARSIGAKLPAGTRRKVRILLSRSGSLRWDNTALVDGPSSQPPLLLVASSPVDESQPLLYHKTTHLPWYLRARDAVERGACYDVLFFNSQGHVTEGCRSNVFARAGGRLYTPPAGAGLLAGVLRERLLKRGVCEERNLTLDEISQAEELFCGNSVRGLVRVRLGGRLP